MSAVPEGQLAMQDPADKNLPEGQEVHWLLAGPEQPRQSELQGWQYCDFRLG